MRMQTFPNDYSIEEHFPRRRLVNKFEGGTISLAEKDGSYYVIADERLMADFLMPGNEDLLKKLILVYWFESEIQRELYLQERGWGRGQDTAPGRQP